MKLPGRKRFFIIIALGIALFFGFCIHYDGPYKGKILELETGEPIEGAVVAAEWRLEQQFIHWEPFCDARETVTDKNGEFELPRAWCIYHPFARIQNPTVVVFKPGYEAAKGWALYSGTPQSIFAIGPSTIGYLEVSKKTINSHTFEVGSKKTKTYPEGLILTGMICQERIKSIKESTPFMIEAFFVPLEGARERIKRLNMQLDCSKDGEPVPHVDQTYDFRNDIEKYIKKSYVVVSLPKLKTRAERRRTYGHAGVSEDKARKKFPMLLKLRNEERRNLGY